MNERIKELSMKYAHKMGNSVLYNAEFLDEFAELIINECAEIGDGYDNETKYNQGLIDIQTAGVEIRKHFGVE